MQGLLYKACGTNKKKPLTCLFSHRNNPRSTGLEENNFQDFPQGSQSLIYLTPGGRTTATAVENYITLFLLLFKASPWGTEAIYALNRWMTK